MIIGNWKMHKLPKDLATFFADFERSIDDIVPDVYLAPPITLLAEVASFAQRWQIQLLAQNIHHAPAGAFTGELSIAMTQEVGAVGSLVGHSERRTLFNETDQAINNKLLACQQQDFTVVLCIGESAQQRQEGETFRVLERQLTTALDGVTNQKLAVAYEPIWAIGTGNVATPEQVQETHTQIKSWCTTHGYHDVPVLYGGSVKPNNAETLATLSAVDGLLVGGASLDGEAFAKIIKSWRQLCG